jgi:hypothetical protein
MALLGGGNARKRYKTLGFLIDQEELRDQFHEALANLLCVQHGGWPKPCNTCKLETRNLVRPLARALVKAAIAVSSPNLDEEEAPKKRSRIMSQEEMIAVGQAVEVIFKEARLGINRVKPPVTQKVTVQPLEGMYDSLS